MNTSSHHRKLWLGGIILVTLICGACVAPGDRYVSGSVSYGVDFYEPYGHDYGGWGPGYMVGPPRIGNRHFNAPPISPPRHSYRPALPSRPMPSIPTRPRPPRRR